MYGRPGPLGMADDVVVPHGSTAAVGAALAADGVIGDALAFRAAAFLTRGDGPLHAAEFAFPAHASLRRVLAVLRNARPVEHALTIAEGLTSAEIAELLAGAAALRGAVTVPPEGSVLPQTYDYERGATRAALLDRMRLAMSATLDAVWKGRSPGLTLRSPFELLALASMV